MSLAEIYLTNFRNLKATKLELHSDLNFIVGDNGSGKSSLLEALFFLGHGKSFRTNSSEHLINSNSDEFVISAKTDENFQLGIKRTRAGDVLIRVNGSKKTKLSELARNIAVQIVTPESFKLFFGGPRERRRFVDLGMFHVEHSFSNNWRSLSRVLKQRNACLKHGDDVKQLLYWTEEFCNYSNLVAESRKCYIETLKDELSFWLGRLLPNITNDISVQYRQGWNSKKELLEVLEQNRQKEFERGHSLFGAHKFDIRFVIGNSPIENKLSRGQQKLFLIALTFAQTRLIEQVKRLKPILLIDDIGAELDTNSRELMFKANQQLNCQTIVTAIDKVALEPLVPTSNNYNMFHVEHGQISAMSK